MYVCVSVYLSVCTQVFMSMWDVYLYVYVYVLKMHMFGHMCLYKWQIYICVFQRQISEVAPQVSPSICTDFACFFVYLCV